MKKIVVLVIALFVGTAFMAWHYFSKLGSENDAKDLALQSATNNAALVFSFTNDKSFYEIIGGQQLLQQLLGNEKMLLLKQIQKSIIHDDTINGFIQDQPVYISILPDSSNTLNFLFTVQIQPDQEIGNLFKQFIKRKNVTRKNNELYSIQLNDSLNAYIGISKQVITLSTSLKLVNDAAVRLSENPFTAYIKASTQNSKNTLLALYINFNQAPGLLKNIIAGSLNGELSVLNKQNGFATLNYNFSKERIIFNGNTEINSAGNYLKIFENTPAQTTSIQNILPDNTANYTLYAFDRYPNWQKKLIEWQKVTGTDQKVQSVIEKIKKEYRTDLNTIFPGYVKNEFIIFQLSTTEKLAAVNLSNGEKVKQLLLDVSTDYNEEIRIFKSPDILYSYFGEPLKKFGRPYYTIIDNHLIAANNASTVQSFLSSYRNNRLLIQSPAYQDAMNQIPATSNITYYINTKTSADLFRSYIKLPYYKHLRADSGLKSFDTFCYQMSADRSKFITNLLINKYIKQEVPDSLRKR